MKKLLLGLLFVSTINHASQFFGGSSGSGSGLPDQTGHAGEFLTTDGAVASWAAIGAGTPASPVNSVQFNNAGAFGGSSPPMGR